MPQLKRTISTLSTWRVKPIIFVFQESEIQSDQLFDKSFELSSHCPYLSMRCFRLTHWNFDLSQKQDKAFRPKWYLLGNAKMQIRCFSLTRDLQGETVEVLSWLFLVRGSLSKVVMIYTSIKISLWFLVKFMQLWMIMIVNHLQRRWIQVLIAFT